MAASSLLWKLDYFQCASWVWRGLTEASYQANPLADSLLDRFELQILESYLAAQVFRRHYHHHILVGPTRFLESSARRLRVYGRWGFDCTI